MKLTDSIDACIGALKSGAVVYAKNGMGDWIRVDQINKAGCAHVADDLSGFNSDTIGRWMTPEHADVVLRIRDFEIQQ